MRFLRDSGPTMRTPNRGAALRALHPPGGAGALVVLRTSQTRLPAFNLAANPVLGGIPSLVRLGLLWLRATGSVCP